jgi:hypothetical protein
MQLTIPALLAALICGQSPQARHCTANFIVQADTAEVAKLVGESAESRRVELAKLWFGDEAPVWASPCRIRVCVDVDRIAACTNIAFAGGKVRSQTVDLQGPLERVLKGPLPHELTHVLFAHHFGALPPKWADEGGAVLSEDQCQAERQNKVLRKVLAEGKCFPLRRLFAQREYPTDVSCFYAQAHSVSRFLVNCKGRRVFLAFVKAGAERGWDAAAAAHYGYSNVEQLEKAWLGWTNKKTEEGSATSSAWLTLSSQRDIQGRLTFR